MNASGLFLTLATLAVAPAMSDAADASRGIMMQPSEEETKAFLELAVRLRDLAAIVDLQAEVADRHGVPEKAVALRKEAKALRAKIDDELATLAARQVLGEPLPPEKPE